jgi:hypothetical protein
VDRISAGNVKRLKYFVLYSLPVNQTSEAPATANFEILLPGDTDLIFYKNKHKALCDNGCVVSLINRNNVESDTEIIK